MWYFKLNQTKINTQKKKSVSIKSTIRKIKLPAKFSCPTVLY